MKKIIIGLTGGIACGKTLASQKFYELGCEIVDTDVISREIMSEVEAKIRDSFPEAFISGNLDRAKLRQIIFGSEKKRILLNSLTHPLIKERALAQISNSQKNIVVVVVPLLFETDFHKLVDISVAISCDEQIRIQRLTKRDNIDNALAEKIISSQMTDKERGKIADYVIKNESTVEDFMSGIERVYSQITGATRNKKSI